MIGTVLLILLIILALCMFAIGIVDNMKKDKEILHKKIISLQNEISAHDAWIANLAEMQPHDAQTLIRKANEFNQRASNNGGRL